MSSPIVLGVTTFAPVPFVDDANAGGVASNYDADQRAALSAITAVSAGFGILGALITLLTFASFRHLRTTVSRLVACMAFADLVALSAKAIGRSGPAAGDTSGLCQAQGALMQWGDLASIFWTVAISVNLIWIVVLRRSVEEIRRMEGWYRAICFLLPLPFAIIPLFIGNPTVTPAGNIIRSMYGDADVWCWIRAEYDVARLGFFYAELWLVFLFNVTTYAIVGRAIWIMANQVVSRTGPNNSVHQHKVQFGKNTSLYLLAFAITWTPSTINRLYQFVNPGQSSFFLSVMMAICSPARGFTNFAVYFYLTWFVPMRNAHSSGRMNRAGPRVRTTTEMVTTSYLPGSLSTRPAQIRVADFSGGDVVDDEDLQAVIGSGLGSRDCWDSSLIEVPVQVFRSGEQKDPR